MKKPTIVIIILLVIIALCGGYIWQHRDGSKDSAGNSANTSADETPKGKTVSMTDKGLTQFPKEVLNDKSIVVLDLSGNELTGSLPAEIKNLSNLEVLNVSSNKMTGIPAEIGQLKKLRVLNYANNQITGLPMELGNLAQLQVFDISGNDYSKQDLQKIQQKLPNTQFVTAGS